MVGLRMWSGFAICDRAYVDHGPSAPGGHAGQHGPGAVDNSLEEHVDLVIKILDRPVTKTADVHKTCVVDETIGWPENGFGLFDSCLKRRKIRDVQALVLHLIVRDTPFAAGVATTTISDPRPGVLQSRDYDLYSVVLHLER